MRIFGYLGIGFLIVWLLAPPPFAVAETAVQVPGATQSPSQPTPEEEDDLLSTLD